jgi:hypothetical protein
VVSVATAVARTVTGVNASTSAVSSASATARFLWEPQPGTTDTWQNQPVSSQSWTILSNGTDTWQKVA